MAVLKQGYTEGDWVVHAAYGIGRITCTESKRLGGDEKLYFRVEARDSIFWIAVETAASVPRLRHVVSREGLQAVIHILQSPPHALSEDIKERRAEIQEVRAHGSLEDIAALIRDLYSRHRVHQLNLSESEALEDLKKRLIHEWAVVMDIPLNEAHQALKAVLEGRVV